MELRDFAEQILFAVTLEEKLQSPLVITDERPGPALAAPAAPGRPADLRFKPQHNGKVNIPRLQDLERSTERGRLLHFFANHELLATELMALVLLRFPDAPPAFRRAVLQTLKDEQEHTRLYLRRMRDCGIVFGELPLSGYFWRAISNMASPLDYVTGLSLTFEQANLDFAQSFARGFAHVGDNETSLLLDRIYRDEIGHVATGLKWFRKWKNPQQSDWDAFCHQLRFPLSAQRAKGPDFNSEGRMAAGFDSSFVTQLQVYSHSKGRTPGVFLFNPFAEGRIAQGPGFTPNKHQQLLQQDLENVPQFLCRQDDVMLVMERPSSAFLRVIKQAGFALPEFVELPAGGIDSSSNLAQRKLGKLCPWAWGPDSVEILRPLFANLPDGKQNPDSYFGESRGNLYSKAWSASLLRKVVASHPDCAPWMCGEQDVGVAADTLVDALEAIEAIRGRGHHSVVIKEALGVAGHNAIRLLEPELLDTQRRWITNVLERGSQVVIEPWLERKLDFSVQLDMSTRGLEMVGYAGLLCNRNGQFRGNWAGPGFRRHLPAKLNSLFPERPDISGQIRALYQSILQQLEIEFQHAGYIGPAGIDAFIYRTSEGKCRLKPIVEINPRYTMGRLTLELMKQVAPGRGGSLQLVTPKRVKTDGFENFPSWAHSLSERYPLRLAGKPVHKINEGFLCLNDPQRARVCLAVFTVANHQTLDSVQDG